MCPQPGGTNKAGEQNPPLPRFFIQLDAKNRHNVDCTSHELNALNSRLKDATNDCMVLTEQVAQSLSLSATLSRGGCGGAVTLVCNVVAQTRIFCAFLHCNVVALMLPTVQVGMQRWLQLLIACKTLLASCCEGSVPMQGFHQQALARYKLAAPADELFPPSSLLWPSSLSGPAVVLQLPFPDVQQSSSVECNTVSACTYQDVLIYYQQAVWLVSAQP